MTYERLEKLCQESDHTGQLFSLLLRAVDEEYDDSKERNDRCSPAIRQVVTEKVRRRWREDAQACVAEWVTAQRYPPAADNLIVEYEESLARCGSCGKLYDTACADDLFKHAHEEAAAYRQAA